MKGILTTYINKDHSDWDVHLPLALFAYRNSVHSSSGVSPFKAIVGREATTPLVLMSPPLEAKHVVLSRLGNVNYHIKPESGNGKAKVVHHNRLKLVKCKPTVKEWLPIDQEQTPRASLLPDEPAVRYRETSMEMQPLAPEGPTILRRSTRCRWQPDRYQDYNLDELEIEDALN